jgi:NitT/TauT family transport system substrate-binding protein
MKTLATLLALALTFSVQAQQKTEEITYLLPAPGFLPAFAPWMLAQQRGYFAQEGL